MSTILQLLSVLLVSSCLHLRCVEARCMSSDDDGRPPRTTRTPYNCPEGCKCSQQFIIDCRNNHIHEVPSELPAGTRELLLHKNSIWHLRLDDFANCKQLNHLDLASNNISLIDNGTFKDCVSLETLELYRNKIDFGKLDGGAFKGLEALTELRIDHNRNSTSYRGDLFQTLTQLVRLDIDGVPEVPFPQEFSRLRKLNELTIYNRLTAIYNDTFAAFEDCPLRKLIIDTRHHLRTLEPMSFGHFHELQRLDLGYNRNLGFKNASKAWYGLQFTNISSIILTSITPDNARPSTINADFFNYLNNTHLTYMQLSRNAIVHIEPRFSEAVPGLLTLHLAENMIENTDDLIRDCAKLKNIRVIDVGNRLNPSPIYHLSTEEDDRLADLIKTDDEAQHYPPGYGKKIPSDKICYSKRKLQKCERKSVAQSKQRQWNTGDVSDNWPKYQVELAPICVPIATSLEFINLIDAIRVPLHTLPQTVIFGGKSMKKLVLNDNTFEQIIGPVIFTEAPKDMAVYLSSNRIKCLAPDVFKISASQGSEITVLFLSHNLLGRQLENDIHGKTFQVYKQLKELNLKSNGIKNLTHDAFVENINIERLHLSHNSLNQITFKFDHMRNLSFVDLSFNLISTLNDTVMGKWSEMFDRDDLNFTINLNGNPLQCSCETLRFLLWIDKYRHHFMNFTKYSCLHKNEYVTFARLSDYILIDLQFECSKRIAVIVAGTLVGFTLLLLAVSAVCYRHRWEIRYACLKLTQRGQRYQELIDLPVEYEYDAFIVYDSEDRQWVNEELMPHLEQLELDTFNVNNDNMAFFDMGIPRPLRLCVHERDFPPGQHIVANIWQRMERSRKVVVVISKNFATSHYCDYEVNLARMQSVEKGRNVLVPVLLELPDVHNVSECLNWVMRKLTYIQWPQHEGEQEDFWQKLREAIGNDIDGNIFRKP